VAAAKVAAPRFGELEVFALTGISTFRDLVAVTSKGPAAAEGRKPVSM
jgi:hypothetical protein